MRHWAGVIEIGLADFAPYQSVDDKRQQGGCQVRQPNAGRGQALDHLKDRVPQHVEPAFDEGKQIVASHILEAFGHLAFALGRDEVAEHAATDAGADEQAIEPALRGVADLTFFIGAKVADHHPVFGALQFPRPAVGHETGHHDHFQ